MTTSRARSRVMPLWARRSAYVCAKRSTSSGSCGGDDARVVEVEAERGASGAHGVLVAEQGEVGDTAPQQDVGGLEDAVVLALGQHDVAAVRSRTLHELELEHQRGAHLGRRDVDGSQQGGLVDALGEEAAGGLDLVARARHHRAAHLHRGLRRVHRVGVGQGDRQVLLHACREARDRLGHLVAAREDDARERRERARLVSEHEPGHEVGAVARGDDGDVGAQPRQDVGQAHRGDDEAEAVAVHPRLRAEHESCTGRLGEGAEARGGEERVLGDRRGDRGAAGRRARRSSPRARRARRGWR